MHLKDIKTIVVGVDFSEYSQLAVQQAKELAKASKSNLVYVFAYEDIDVGTDMALLDRTRVSKLYMARVRSTYHVDPGHSVVIRFGRAENEIVKVANEEKDPMILVGHRGGHLIAKFFLGSVAENLATLSPFPLWIHRGDKVFLPGKILVPSDLSRESERIIEEVQGWKSLFGSEFEVYHVFRDPMPILDYAAWTSIYNQMKKDDDEKLKLFKMKHPDLNVVVEQGVVSECIRQRAKDFDLIALGPNDSSKKRMAFGKVSSKVVRSGDTPILMVP